MDRIQRTLQLGVTLLAIRIASGRPEEMVQPGSANDAPTARRLVATMLASLGQ